MALGWLLECCYVDIMVFRVVVIVVVMIFRQVGRYHIVSLFKECSYSLISIVLHFFYISFYALLPVYWLYLYPSISLSSQHSGLDTLLYLVHCDFCFCFSPWAGLRQATENPGTRRRTPVPPSAGSRLDRRLQMTSMMLMTQEKKTLGGGGHHSSIMCRYRQQITSVKSSGSPSSHSQRHPGRPWLIIKVKCR